MDALYLVPENEPINYIYPSKTSIHRNTLNSKFHE
jgi:hypothetical protein